MRALVVWLILIVAVSEGGSQLKTPTRARAVPQRIRLLYSPRQTTISFSLGISPPVSHDGLTNYWRTGPGGSVRVLFSCSKYLKMGFGSDLSIFYFRKSNSQATQQALALRVEDASILSGYIAIRLYVRPALRLSPFIEGNFGFSHITPSAYRLVVNDVPTVIYDLRKSDHLSAGLVGGFDYYLSRKVAFEIDVKANYIDGTAEVGLIMFAGAGLKFTL
jgi:hypothetical protein